MAIEFRCETCGKLLRTGHENRGRSAVCPGCGDTLAVPPDQEGWATNPNFGPVDPVSGKPSQPAEPHRGGLILVFGILSWAMCFVFGVVAWSMGTADLQAMRAGVMDNSGESLTRAGMYLGMANVIVVLLGVLTTFVIIGLAIFA